MKGMRSLSPSAQPPVLGALKFKTGWIPGLMHDLTIALHNIRIRPSFSLMGACFKGRQSAIFSIFNSLFLRPLPFPASSQLIDLDETAPKWNLKYVGVSNIDSFEWSKSKFHVRQHGILSNAQLQHG
jgi:hypothetical protein